MKFVAIAAIVSEKNAPIMKLASSSPLDDE
jgi:hypothetical protein